MVLKPCSTEVPPRPFQIVGGLKGQDSSSLLPTLPPSPRKSVPFTSICILKFQLKTCLSKNSTAKQEFKSKWSSPTCSFLHKCATEKVSTLLERHSELAGGCARAELRPASRSTGFSLSLYQGLVFFASGGNQRIYFVDVAQSPHSSAFSPSLQAHLLCLCLTWVHPSCAC